MTIQSVIPRLVLGLVMTATAIWFALNRDRLDPAMLESAIRDLGLLAPVAHIALFVGKISTNVDALGADLLTIAGHKIYAPKGIGALYVRRGTSVEPLVHGAGHEDGRRAGTESALLAVGLGTACALACDLETMEQVRAQRDQFWQKLQAKFGDRVVLNGHPDHRLPNTHNVSFCGRVGPEILAELDGVAASIGSACHTGHVELSPVLKP